MTITKEKGLVKYRSRARINGYRVHIGQYDSAEKALEAEKVARGEQGHNFFLNENEFNKILQIRQEALNKPKKDWRDSEAYKTPAINLSDLNTKLDLILELLHNTHKKN